MSQTLNPTPNHKFPFLIHLWNLKLHPTHKTVLHPLHLHEDFTLIGSSKALKQYLHVVGSTQLVPLRFLSRFSRSKPGQISLTCIEGIGCRVGLPVPAGVTPAGVENVRVTGVGVLRVSLRTLSASMRRFLVLICCRGVDSPRRWATRTCGLLPVSA